MAEVQKKKDPGGEEDKEVEETGTEIGVSWLINCEPYCTVLIMAFQKTIFLIYIAQLNASHEQVQHLLSSGKLSKHVFRYLL
jgi:hypothetical protein